MDKAAGKASGGMAWKKLIVPILVLFLLLSLASTAYLFKQVQSLKQDPQKVALAEVQELLAEVGQLMILPSDETPTVATVSDPEKLKTQAFFANAKKGDKVLLYTNAKKAILYSPESRKIVEVAPINIGNAAPSSEVAGDTTTDGESEVTQP